MVADRHDPPSRPPHRHTVELMYQLVTDERTGDIEVSLSDGAWSAIKFNGHKPTLKMWRAILAVATEQVSKLEQEEMKAHRTVARELHENWRPIDRQHGVLSASAWVTDRFRVWSCGDNPHGHLSPSAHPAALKGATHYWLDDDRWGVAPPLYKEPT